MSVLIKGMAMPETCKRCDFETDELLCDLTGGHTDDARKSGRLESCPLVEVKEPHGDLIDRQKLLEDNKHLEYPTDGKYRRDRAWSVGFNAGARHCNEHAVYAKTVVEAEGGD